MQQQLSAAAIGVLKAWQVFSFSFPKSPGQKCSVLRSDRVHHTCWEFVKRIRRTFARFIELNK